MRGYRSLQILIFLVASFLEVRVKAAELIEPYTSVRAAGMGNAYAPIVQDADALFYNPAGIAAIDSYNWQLLNFNGGVNGAQVVSLAEEISNGGDISSVLGQHLWVGGSAKTAVFMPGFAAAYYDVGSLRLDATNPALPNLNLTVMNDLAYALGAGFAIAPGFQAGIVLRRLMRSGGPLTIGTETITNFDPAAVENLLATRGIGYGLDLGINFIFPTPLKPTVSMVWKNVGRTSFVPEYTGNLAPPPIEDEITFGFGMRFESLLFDILPVLEYKHANRYDLQLGQKLHLGLELGFPMLDVRGGFHQGYYSWGLGADLGFVRFDVATYGVELGEYPGQKEDRRWMLEFTMGLGFDPNFNFLGLDSTGKGKKRLKRRR